MHTDTAAYWLHDCLAVVRDVRWVSFEPWPTAVLAEANAAGDEFEAGAVGVGGERGVDDGSAHRWYLVR